MTKLLTEIQFIAAVPMTTCPPGLETGWLNIILHAMCNTYHQLQGQPPPEIEEAQLATLFDSLAEQWLQMRQIAVQRGVRLPIEYDHPISVQEWRMLFCDADALNMLFPEQAA